MVAISSAYKYLEWCKFFQESNIKEEVLHLSLIQLDGLLDLIK